MSANVAEESGKFNYYIQFICNCQNIDGCLKTHMGEVFFNSIHNTHQRLIFKNEDHKLQIV